MNPFGDTLVTAPTWEPITVEQARGHVRVRQGKDVEYLAMCITDAREYVEVLSRRALPQQQWDVTYDRFPGRTPDDFRPTAWRFGVIELPRPPLISVDAVSYVATDQASQPFTYTAFTEYQVDPRREPARLAPAPYAVWPQTNPLALAAVKIRITCGYASAALVPGRLKRAILLLVGHLYEHREDSTEAKLDKIPDGMRAFIRSAATGSYTV